MKKFLLLTVMCVLGLFGTLRAQETSFSYDFEDGTLTGWRAYQGEGTTTDNAWQVAEGKGVDGSMGIYSYSCKLVPPFNIPMEYFVNNYVVTQNAYAITETSVFSWNQGNESIYSDPSCDQITVIVSEDGSDFSTIVWSGTGENTGDLSVSLAEYAGKSLYIGFHHFQTTSYGDGEIRLDNIALTSEGGSEGGEEPEPEPQAPTAPANLVAEAAGTNSIVLTWDAVEGATTYKVYDEEDVIGEATETTYTVEGLAAATNYCFVVTAVNEVGESLPSAQACATTEEEQEENPDTAQTITIGGDGVGSSAQLPTNMYFNYSLTQQIYTGAEMNYTVGDVTKVAFYQTSEVSPMTRNIVVYMLNTEKEYFSTWTDWVPVTSADIVYEGTFTTSEMNTWVEIELQTPFAYAGGNFVLCIHDVTGSYANEAYFKTYEVVPEVENTGRTLGNYRDAGAYNINNLAEEYGNIQTQLNTVQFSIISEPGLSVNPKDGIDFGTIQLGNYWPEKAEASVKVTVGAVERTVASITTDNDFFVLPEIDMTATPITFNVGYDKEAADGTYNGTLTVTAAEGDVIEVPMTAVVYTPVEPDVFELAKEITFTDDAYTDTPDFATLHDDYVLPNEGENGHAPDAVYSFTLEEEKIIKAGVEGEGGFYAIYRADSIGEGKGPQANNNYKGTDKILSTAFEYDFEDGSLDAFTTQDLDEYTDFCWAIENGQLVSYSFYNWYDEDDNYAYIDKADERIITNDAYTITPNTVLTFDMQRENSSSYQNVTVEITKDGQEFTSIRTVEVHPDYWDDYQEVYPEDFDENGNYITLRRINLGEEFIAAGLEYGDYRISLRAYNSGAGILIIDNLALTERAGVYEAGDYYMVAAAKAAFTLNVELQGLGGDEPEEEPEFDPEALYRLVSKTGDVSETVYEYTSEKGTTVVSVDQDGLVETMEYTDGVLVGYAAKNGEETLSEVKYTYDANGVMTAYSESTMSWNGNMFTQEYAIEYNTDGKVVSVAASDYKYTFAYDANGLVTEKTANYLYEDGSEELDYKEVYTYENGRLVNTGWYTYDWMLEQEALAEEKVYEYDANGNCNKVVTYSVYEDEESGDVVKDVYMVAEYKYSTKVAIENVYTFDYPHMALINPAVPAQANILYNEYTYGIDPETEEVYPYSDVDYIYEAYELEEEQGFGAPTNVKATAISDTKIELSWDAVEGATEYGIYLGDYYLGPTPYTGAELIGFEANSTYCFTVTAFDAAGNESEHSEEACATTLDAPTEAPATPTNLVGEYLADTQEIRLTWDPVENADTYNLYLFDMPMGEVSGTAVRVGDLDPTVTEYCFKVSAVNTAGESALSEEVCVSTVGVEEMSATFNIYPNPVNDVLFIENSNNIEQVTIYSVTGVMVYSEECTSNNVQVNVADLEAGVYIIKVRTENNEVINRFIKK